jgi:hypothetical protein
MPGFQGPPSRPYTPTPNAGPMDPSIIAHTNMPQGTPSDTPRPGGAGGSPLPPRRPKNLGVTPSGNASPPSSNPTPSSNPLFGTFQTQVPGQGRGPLSSNPIITTLNLPELFKRMRSS